MYCPTCNTLNRDDAKFCKSCGHPLHANVGAQSTIPTSAPSQPNAGDNVEGIEDISTAPTEILSPERMAALHNRLWQQDQEREPQYDQAAASEPQTGTANGTADMPTVWSGGAKELKGAPQASPITEQ